MYFNYSAQGVQRSVLGLAFEAAKLKCNLKIELPTELPMVEFFEKGIRGGFANCFQRYFAAPNTAMYTKEQLEKFPFEEYDALRKEAGGSPAIKYWDTNNLYGIFLFLPPLYI